MSREQMTDPVHIVEPTLSGENGHCHSFISSLTLADTSIEFVLWANRCAEVAVPGNVRLQRFFSRKIRRIQAFFLYRRLMKEPGKIFISTAGRPDLILLNWASAGTIPPDKVYLYFHWLRLDDKKRRTLARIAERQPDLICMGPTDTVVAALRDCGFRKTHLVPYPISSPVPLESLHTVHFSHLLFAGAARRDKGIASIARLVAHMHSRGLELPIVIQATADHFDKFDSETTESLARLGEVNYSFLQLVKLTLSAKEYQALYRGAICLQPYDKHDFADRISGITLDSLLNGCPVITVAGTWMAHIVERFAAGIVVPDADADLMLTAAERIVSEYPRYQRNALHGGHILQRENSAALLLASLVGNH